MLFSLACHFADWASAAPGAAGEPAPVRLSALNRVRTDTSSFSPRTEVCASIQAFIPPSTVRFAPVMYEDSGPATNATSAATSSTFP
jgi:hypothetical protein